MSGSITDVDGGNDMTIRYHININFFFTFKHSKLQKYLKLSNSEINTLPNAIYF